MPKFTYMQSPTGNIFYTSHPEYHLYDTKLTQTEGKRLYRLQVKEQLLARIKPGKTIFIDVVSVARSGMSRSIKCYIVDGECIMDISGDVAEVTGNKWSDKNGGVVMSGCGMDMAFKLVYDLGRALWPDGTPSPHGTRNGVPDSEGGYALKKENL